MGAHFVSFPLDVASNSDVVFSIVGYPSDVRSVLIGPQGALHGLKPGGVLVNMTKVTLLLLLRSFLLPPPRVVLLLMPQSLGVIVGAKTGTLAIFAGGDESVVKRLDPLFNCLGKVNYMGGPGKGQFAKLANQIPIASTMVGFS